MVHLLWSMKLHWQVIITQSPFCLCFWNTFLLVWNFRLTIFFSFGSYRHCPIFILTLVDSGEKLAVIPLIVPLYLMSFSTGCCLRLSPGHWWIWFWCAQCGFPYVYSAWFLWAWNLELYSPFKFRKQQAILSSTIPSLTHPLPDPRHTLDRPLGVLLQSAVTVPHPTPSFLISAFVCINTGSGLLMVFSVVSYAINPIQYIFSSDI